MENVIVTVKFKDQNTSFDLEMPTNVPAQELSLMIVQALNTNISSTSKIGGYHIHADPPGRILEDDETFEEVGIWDGSILTLI